MALSAPRDTLAYHNARVLCSLRDMSAVPTKSVTAAVAAFMAADKHKGTVPETEALKFYGMNHGVALVSAHRDPLEPLPKAELRIVETYHAQMVPSAVRAFYYLLMICTREARHAKNLSAGKAYMTENFGASVFDFYDKVNGGEPAIHAKLLSDPPNASIGAYCKSLQWVFYNLKWAGGYGGKKWGMIADCLSRFVHGEYSAEMMLDTIWTLSHNNGPIFNKGLMYAMYTGTIIRILDVQRSGQIPEMILTEKSAQPFVVTTDLAELMMHVSNTFPGKIGSYVDWLKVEALGATQSYPSEIAMQKKLGQMSPEALAKLKAQELAAIEQQKMAAAKKAQEKAEFEANHFEIMPGNFAKKFKMQRAA